MNNKFLLFYSPKPRSQARNLIYGDRDLFRANVYPNLLNQVFFIFTIDLFTKTLELYDEVSPFQLKASWQKN